MTTKHEFKGATVESAIDAGLKELKLTREDAEIEILSNGGFLKKAMVAICRKEGTAAAPVEEATEEQTLSDITEETDDISERQPESDNGEGKIFIEKVLELMNIPCTVEERIKKSEIAYYVKGEEAHRVIGYRGETLDALQHLVTCKINRDEKKYDRIMVDADFYRQKREQTLINLARRLAKQAASSNAAVELEPMNSFERRIIHAALQDSTLASSRSEGEGRDRHIIIAPKDGSPDSTLQYGSSDFKKTGPKRTKSYGYSRKRF